MTPSQQAALDKIKKLLRMRRGGTAGEIENALAMAAKLAREHGIDLDSVNPDDEQHDRPIGHSSVPYGARVPAEMNYATSIVINFFNVSVVIIQKFSARNAWVFRGKPRFVADYIGTDWDIEVARYVFHFLVAHFRRSWRLRENRRLSNRQAYFYGMFIGICAKLRRDHEPQPQSPGLIPQDRQLARRNAYLDKLHPGSKDKNLPDEDSDATAARTAGYYDGLKTEIRPGLDRADAPGSIGTGRLAIGMG